MWRLSTFLLPVPKWPLWCGDKQMLLMGVVRVTALPLWKRPGPSALFQWLCKHHKVVPICALISPGSRQENRNSLRNFQQVAELYTEAPEDQRADPAIKSHTTGSVLELGQQSEGGISSSELQSKLTAGGAPEGGKGRQATKEGLLHLALGLCKEHSLSPGCHLLTPPLGLLWAG